MCNHLTSSNFLLTQEPITFSPSLDDDVFIWVFMLSCSCSNKYNDHFAIIIALIIDLFTHLYPPTHYIHTVSRWKFTPTANAGYFEHFVRVNHATPPTTPYKMSTSQRDQMIIHQPRQHPASVQMVPLRDETLLVGLLIATTICKRPSGGSYLRRIQICIICRKQNCAEIWIES